MSEFVTSDALDRVDRHSFCGYHGFFNVHALRYRRYRLLLCGIQTVQHGEILDDPDPNLRPCLHARFLVSGALFPI